MEYSKPVLVEAGLAAEEIRGEDGGCGDSSGCNGFDKPASMPLGLDD